MDGPSRASGLSLFVMAVIMAATIVTTESCFDSADRRKSLALVMEPSPRGPNLPAEMARDGAPPRCDAAISDSCRGLVTVTCYTSSSEPYRFNADLLHRHADPLDDHTRALVERAKKAMPAAPAGPAATGAPAPAPSDSGVEAPDGDSR